MDLAIIIGSLLQIGIGAAMVFAIEYRRKRLSGSRNPQLWSNRHPKLWKISIFIALVWGWSVIIWTTYQLIIYLVANLHL
jgi:uncharacterized membrane protein YbhN (UPF0104 family)